MLDAWAFVECLAVFDTLGTGGDNPGVGPTENQAVEDPELDDKLHQMLRELRRALSEAISDSAEVNRTLRKIREEGYALYLLVDCKRESLDEEPLSLTAPSFRSGSGEPVFQIDGRDLNFLRSIGIDPTRRLRRRKTTAT
jgi:hypothetical protein